MTRTEERLADALDAAARALREDTLRPLLAPARRQHRRTLATPLAAAAAMLLVVGVGVAVAKLAAPGRPSSTPPGPPPYYVEAGFPVGLPQVRSTATGAVTDTVRVPSYVPSGLGPNMVAAAGNGVFFAAVTQSAGERIWRFRLTADGRVSDLAPVRGGTIDDSQFGVGAMAASPDGTRLAVALNPTTSASTGSCSTSGSCTYTNSGDNGYIDVINTANGERNVWRGGTGQNFLFSVVSLSWVGNGNKLAYLGEWCSVSGGNSASSCLPGTGTGGAKAELHTLDATTGGGSLTSGQLLFRTSAAFPDLPQALLSPDGSTITAASVTSSAGANGTPTQLVVEQISVATRKPPRVLYRQDLRHAFGANHRQGYVVLLTLKSDVAAQYWMVSGLFCDVDRCNGGVNGWIDGGRLVPLQPAGQIVGSEAW